jgi:acetate kinase
VILVINAGSTSVKLHLVDEAEQAETIDSLEAVDASSLEGIGFRVVHGGPRFREPVLLDEGVERELRALSPLAPLHNAPALRAVEDARRAFPSVPLVAAFDTAFHASLPREAATYAVPRRWEEDWDVRRYGFHGLSVQWAAGRVRVARLVVCHLGGGSSVTAVADGRSVDTTMGFSPLEGVPMTTRSGSIDTAVVLYLVRERGLAVDEVGRMLEHESGLKALSGLSGDVRELEDAEASGDGRARLALSVYVHRIAAAVAAMSASLRGLDALVFTAGIGENSVLVRARVCERLGFLGVELDARQNEVAKPDAVISSAGSRVAVHVLHAREELVVARAVRSLLSEL